MQRPSIPPMLAMKVVVDITCDLQWFHWQRNWCLLFKQQKQSYFICLVFRYIGRFNVGRYLDQVVHGIMHQLPLKRGFLWFRHVQRTEKIQCCAVEVNVGVHAVKEWAKKGIFSVKKRSLWSVVSCFILAINCQLFYKQQEIRRVEKHLVGKLVGGRRDRVFLPLARGEAAHSWWLLNWPSANLHLKKWPEKLRRYAPTKGNQEKT